MNKGKYGVYSKFDINKHKETFINYLEVIILPNGEIQYAVPSHQEKLIQLTGIDREKLWETIPVWSDVLNWLLDYTGCISVWSDFYIGEPRTPEQEEVLQLLIDEGLTKK